MPRNFLIIVDGNWLVDGRMPDDVERTPKKSPDLSVFQLNSLDQISELRIVSNKPRPRRSVAKKVKKEDGITFEKLLNTFNPWDFEFRRPVLVLCIITFASTMGNLFITLSFKKPEEFGTAQHHECLDEVVRTSKFDPKKWQMPPLDFGSIADDEYVGMDKARVELTEIGIEVIAAITCLLLFVQNPPSILTSNRILLICCGVGAFSCCLIATSSFTQVAIGFLFHEMASRIAKIVSVDVLVGTAPKGLRDFGMIMSSFMATLSFLVFAALFVLTSKYIVYFPWFFWFAGGVILFLIGFESIQGLMCSHKIDQLKQIFEKMTKFSTFSVDIDRIVDDVLYGGRDAEPEDAIDAFDKISQRDKPLSVLLFYFCLLYFTDLEGSFKNPYGAMKFTNYSYLIFWISLYSGTGMLLMTFVLIKVGRKRTMEICLCLITLFYAINACLPLLHYDDCLQKYVHIFGAYPRPKFLTLEFVPMIQHVFLLMWSSSYGMLNLLARLGIAELTPQSSRLFMMMCTHVVSDLIRIVWIEYVSEVMVTNNSYFAFTCLRIIPFIFLFAMTAFVDGYDYDEVAVTYNDLRKRFGIVEEDQDDVGDYFDGTGNRLVASNVELLYADSRAE